MRENKGSRPPQRAESYFTTSATRPALSTTAGNPLDCYKVRFVFEGLYDSVLFFAQTPSQRVTPDHRS